MKWSEIVGEDLKDLQVNIDPNLPDDVDDENAWRFNDLDKKHINNPKLKDLFTRKLKNVPFDLYLYIVDTKESREHVGLASADVSRPLVASFVDMVQDSEGYIGKMALTQAAENFAKNREAVHLLISHNDPYANDHMVLSPWIALHRLAHAVMDSSSDYAKLDTKVGEIREVISEIPRTVWTFKSAKTADSYEIVQEVFVSFLMSGGKLKPNLQELSGDQKAQIESSIEYLNTEFTKILSFLKGKLWIG